MKLTVIVVLFSVLLVAMIQAAPVGPNVHTLAERAGQGYYAKVTELKKIHRNYVSEIDQFNKELPVAAAKDGTNVPPFISKWNNRYKGLVDLLHSDTKKLEKSIQHLFKFLDS
ncbi:7725_t:CDS:1 [Paraglomus occultum]|uniref:7725_t:CDS:1 n=1 Tax=Paraglomus occultum TaxID=144539 RepID=A0A9N9BTI6_9GLOM|nr:7725_t:CDS:1 [Paraglomus occultum]